MPKDILTESGNNCIKTKASCVIWDLDPIPCLDINTGDPLTKIVLNLVEKMCSEDIDLENIDITRLVDIYGISEPKQKTIQSLLQTLINLV